MGIISDRLTKWACNHNLLSPEQKSARPCEGCHQHTFFLSSLIKDTKRNQTKTSNIAWLDLRNAFGSIPHQAIHAVLTTIGAPANLVMLRLKDTYTEASTSFLSKSGETDPIQIQAGVKPGMPHVCHPVQLNN